MIDGIKKDQGKNRWDLLPFDVIEWAVKTMTFGAEKYGPNNWKKVENAEERYFAALMRHLTAYRCGEKFDPETKYPHLAHALCCLIFMFWFSLRSESSPIRTGEVTLHGGEKAIFRDIK